MNRLFPYTICIVLVLIDNTVIGESKNVQTAASTNPETLSLQREVSSLQERLQLSEMKHETLQAVSDQFRLNSKNAKIQLEGERRRYEILASEKKMLETSFESKLANALEEQKSNIEDSILSEQLKRKASIEHEKNDLAEKINASEQKVALLKQNLNDQYKRYEALEKKKVVSEEQLLFQIEDLNKRLSSGESQTKSIQDSWKDALAELYEKDELLQKETNKRIEEAYRWEERIDKLNTELTSLMLNLRKKETELQSKKEEMTKIKKVQYSLQDELMALKNDKSALLEENELNRDDLRLSLSREKEFLREGKQRDSMNISLQRELMETKFKLESYQNRTKQSIEEKSELAKTYKAALNKLTSENNYFRAEFTRLEYEVESSRSKTMNSVKEAADIVKEKRNLSMKLESERIELEKSRLQYAMLEIDYEDMIAKYYEFMAEIENLSQQIINLYAKHDDAISEKDGVIKQLLSTESELMPSRNESTSLNQELIKMTDNFDKSRDMIKHLNKCIDVEISTKRKIENELVQAKAQMANNLAEKEKLRNQFNQLSRSHEELKERQQTKEQKLTSAQKCKAKLQKDIESAVAWIEELKHELNQREVKNNYLQTELLEVKYKLEESRDESKQLEVQLDDAIEASKSNIVQLEVEKNKILELKRKLEAELNDSSSAHITNIREINFLRERLNNTELQLVKLKNEYEFIKIENDAYQRNSTAVSLDIKQKADAIEECNANLQETKSKLKASNDSNNQYVQNVKHQIREKQKSQETCDRELKAAKVMLKVSADSCSHDVSKLNLKLKEKENALNKCGKLLNATLESKNIEIQNCNDKFREVSSINSDLTQDLALVMEKIEQNEEKISFQQNAIGRVLKEKSVIANIALERKNELTEIKLENLQLIVDLTISKEKRLEVEMMISGMESLFLRQETKVAELQELNAVMEKLIPQIYVGEAFKDTGVRLEIEDISSKRNFKLDYVQNLLVPPELLNGISKFVLWLDSTISKSLSVIVDEIRSFASISNVKNARTFINFDCFRDGFASFKRILLSPLKYGFFFLTWTLNEVRIIHDAIVSLFEFEMTFISSLLSSEKDRISFSYLIRHSRMFVVFGEVTVMLLLIDFVISYCLNPKRRKGRPKATKIQIPKTANASLLKKAKNI